MKIGFIGCGNIAGAMIGSIIKEGVCKPSDIIGSDMYPPSLEETKRTYGIRTALKNVDVVKNSEVIFLTIKPQFYEIVRKEIKPMITPKHLIITVAPGKTLDWVGELIGKKYLS